jgi:hypothetical protein
VKQDIGLEPLFVSVTECFLDESLNLVVQTLDRTGGVERNVIKEMPIAFSSGSGAFYHDNACTKKTENLSIAVGTSRLILYFKDNVAESVLLKVSGPLEPASIAFKVTSLPPSRLAVTGASDISSGTCSLYQIASQDNLGGASPVSATTSVLLSGEGQGAFYASPLCKTENRIAKVTLQKNATTTQFYFKDDTVQKVLLTADDEGELAAGTLNVTIR